MDPVSIKQELNEKGYCIVDNILSKQEVTDLKEEFYRWQKTIPNYKYIHRQIEPHGIHKYYEVGHTRFAWLMRINPKIQAIFKELWDSDDLITSFVGSCYVPKEETRNNKVWTHTDQAPNNSEFCCVQSFMSLTENKERTLVVYEGSHKNHESYFKDRGISHSKNWHKIDLKYLKEIDNTKRALYVKPGSLVLWDSRTFHQNQFGKHNSEERIVQYLCYLPKNHKKNTGTMIAKRRRYFATRRTTSHWPAPISVNSLQPNCFGDKSLNINYSKLISSNLNDISIEIEKLL